jgi:hypothetical protein
MGFALGVVLKKQGRGARNAINAAMSAMKYVCEGMSKTSPKTYATHAGKTSQHQG